MMMSEFIDRTGFEPTTSEYERIEKAYYDFDGDKDAFCKAFANSPSGRPQQSSGQYTQTQAVSTRT